MSRRAIAWLLAFPLMAAGTILVHALAYRLALPNPTARADALARSGHSYLGFVPVVLGTCGAFLVAGLASALRGGRRGYEAVPAGWQLALLPPVAFAIQEHAERLLATGHFPLHAAAEPSFLPGLALQLPFALLAVLLARLLSRAAAALGRALSLCPPLLLRSPCGDEPVAVVARPPLPALAFGQPQRGPPR